MWDFMHIDDAITALIKLIEQDCPDGVYNFGSGDSRILREFVEVMRKSTKSESVLRFGKIPYPKTGRVSIEPDITKLQEKLNFEPVVSFEVGIKKIVEDLSN